MNEQLIKFIELCLVDGVITEKEREVIFRKSEELGVPKDECEIILESMIHSSKDTVLNNDLDSELKNEIQNLDNEILKDFIEYIQRIEGELNRVSSSDYVKQSFIEWYKKNGRKPFFREWYVNRFGVKPIFNGLSDEEIYGVGKSYSGEEYLYTSKRIYKVRFVEEKKLFSSKKKVVGITHQEVSLEEFDPLDFSKNKNIGIFYNLLRIYDKDISVFNSLHQLFKELKVTFNPNFGLKYLKNRELFGEELVVKVSNQISNIIQQFQTHLDEIQYHQVIPFKDLTFGKRGLNSQLQNLLEFNIYMVRNISNLIHLRNELIISILGNDRISIKLLKEKMDDLGLLMNYYEKQKLEKMDETIKVLREGFESLTSVLSEISENISGLNITLGSMDSKLGGINESLKFNNLLNMINTYQIYKINLNTKK